MTFVLSPILMEVLAFGNITAEKISFLVFHLLRPEFLESRFSSPDIESETRKVRNSSPIPSPILTRFELRDRFRVRFRVLSRETGYFESETPILPIKPVEINPNFKSDTRGNITSSPIPSPRLGNP